MKNNSVIRFAVAAALAGASSLSMAAWNTGSTEPGPYALELPKTALTLKGPSGQWSLKADPLSYGPTTSQPLVMTVRLLQGAKFTSASAPKVVCDKFTKDGTADGSLTATLVFAGTSGASTAIFEIGFLGGAASAFRVGVTADADCELTFAEIQKAASDPHQTISASINFRYGTFASGTQGGAIVTWATGLESVFGDGEDNTALLEANFRFLDDSGPNIDFSNKVQGGQIEYQTKGGTVLNKDGTAISVSDVVETTGTTITFTGDPLKALASIYAVDDDNNCSAGGLSDIGGTVTPGSNTVTLTGAGITPSRLSEGWNTCFVFNGEDSIPYGPISAVIAPRLKTGYSTVGNLTDTNNVTVYRNGLSALAYNIPGSASSDQAFIRITNTSPTAGRLFGQLIGQDGTDLGYQPLADNTVFTAQKTLVFTAAQLETIFGTTWTGRARLIVNAETPSLAVANTIRNANGTLVNMSPANVARQCTYLANPLNGLGSGGLALGVNYNSDCTPSAYSGSLPISAAGAQAKGKKTKTKPVVK